MIRAVRPNQVLSLPTLPNGWVYEGWAVVDGTPYSTGTFSSVTGSDSDGAGPTAGPDMVRLHSPVRISLIRALSLTPSTAVISIEPVPDNSPAPFALKPLVGTVGSAAAGTLVTLPPTLAPCPRVSLALARRPPPPSPWPWNSAVWKTSVTTMCMRVG